MLNFDQSERQEPTRQPSLAGRETRLPIGPLTFEGTEITYPAMRIVVLDDRQFRLATSVLGKPERSNTMLVTLPHAMILHGGAKYGATSEKFIVNLLSSHNVFASYLLARGLPKEKSTLLQTYGELVTDFPSELLLHELEQIDSDVTLHAVELQAAQVHPWSKRYRDTRIDTQTSALAPLNVGYLEWSASHGDLRQVYAKQNPDESAEDQRLAYEHYFEVKGNTSKGEQRAESVTRNGNPLLVPDTARIEIAPYVRDRSIPKYVQFIVSWGGEWLGPNNKTSNRITYRARFHTNTQDFSGKPPSFVISREYLGQSERLVAPSRRAVAALQHSKFAPHATMDAAGNLWISDVGANLASEFRRLSEGQTLLESIHYPYWVKSILRE